MTINIGIVEQSFIFILYWGDKDNNFFLFFSCAAGKKKLTMKLRTKTKSPIIFKNLMILFVPIFIVKFFLACGAWIREKKICLRRNQNKKYRCHMNYWNPIHVHETHYQTYIKSIKLPNLSHQEGCHVWGGRGGDRRYILLLLKF